MRRPTPLPPLNQENTPAKEAGRQPGEPGLPAIAEPADSAESELELDYRSFEEQCKAHPLPPGIALPPPAGPTYGELFHHTYTLEPEDPDEA